MASKNLSKNLSSLLIIALPFLLIALFTHLSFGYTWDERAYVATAQVFWEKLPQVDFYNYFQSSPEWQSFHAPVLAVTPVFPALLTLLGGVSGFNLVILRLLSVIFGFLSAWFMLKILEELKIKDRIPKVILLVVYPYFILLSSLVMTESISMFLALLSTYFFIRKKYVASMIAVTIAIYTRQTFIFLSAAFICYHIVTVLFMNQANKDTDEDTLSKDTLSKKHHKKHQELKRGVSKVTSKVTSTANSKTTLKIKQGWQNLFTRTNLLIISKTAFPIILFLPLIFYWGGITPHGYRLMGEFVDHQVTFSMAKISFFMIFIGATFFPYLLLHKGFKPDTKQIIMLPLVALFTATIPRDCFGIICSVARMNYDSHYAFMLVLFLLGLAVLTKYFFTDFKEKNKGDILFLILSGMWLIVTATGNLVRERYYLMAVPFLIPVFYRKVDKKDRWVLWASIAVFSLMSLLYVYFKLFIQKSGV